MNEPVSLEEQQRSSVDVKQYQRTKLVLSLVGTGIFVLYAAVWVWWQGRPLLEVSDNRWLGLFLFAGVFMGLQQIISIPLSYYDEFIVEHRFEQSNQTIGRWLSQMFKDWAVGALLGGLILAGLYACVWYAGSWWWLWVWLGWIGLTVVLAQLFPVLLLPVFYKSQPLDDQELSGQLGRLADGSGIRVEGVFSINLSADTKAANAMLTGLGPTRRVYLSDTLLQAFSADEIKVIFAHELGHHVRHHIWKLLLLSAALATLNILVLVYFLSGPAADDWRLAVQMLPSCTLAITLIGLLVKPIYNGISRHFERQCDSDALSRTRDPQAYRSAFQRLSEMNLADPEPHPFVEWYFHDHPAIGKRLAMADDVAPVTASSA